MHLEYLHMCLYMEVSRCMCHAHVEVRGQLREGGFLLYYVGLGLKLRLGDKSLARAVSLAWEVVLRK